ncbi:MAG: hypothetical protein JXQ71_06065 [Verrucomicrobia bacterium]|nr:hypothetical protein [Verrucomicrobiota bacterium]
MNSPQDRIHVIEGSLRCFCCGLLGIVPLVGVAASFIAFHHYHRTRRQAGGAWNPARRHLRLGYALGWFGVAANGALAALAGALALGSCLA